jgi:hypothetical protein
MKFSSQVIPSQLHELLPLYEDSKVWLWLSRVVFHFNKALASSLLSKVAVVNAQKQVDRSSQKGNKFMD